ncbi:hypothetical protein JCM11641_005435 [Rhodosporidiobolus odoratus]
MRLSRLSAYGLFSTTLFLWTILNAFRQRSNFYAAAVYLAKSNACMMILWNQAIYQTVLLGKVVQAIFLGELRLIEIERLQERSWFAITETLLALTIFKDDFDSSFVALFVSLLFLKVFHWLASDRVEMMEQAARLTRLTQARLTGLISVLWAADILFLVLAVDSILLEGPTVMIMFASEYLILIANIWSVSAKYIINTIDMRSEEAWEEKSVYVFYVELAADFFKLVTYLSFFGLILTFYGLPLNILRDVYITLRSFLLKIRDLRRFRQATRNMDTLYPNATREEMAQMTDKTCIICREDMEYRPAPGEAVEEGEGQAGQEVQPPQQHQQTRRGPNDTPKKLPCGHVFHFHCLKSWLERQQSCPTCRRPVLPQEQPQPQPGQPGAAARLPGQPNAPNAGAPRQPGAAAAEEAIRQAQINIARNLGREAFGVMFPGIPFPPEADAPGAAPRLPQPHATGGPLLAPPPIPARHVQDPAAVPLPPTPSPTTPVARPSTPVAGPSTPAPSFQPTPTTSIPPTGDSTRPLPPAIPSPATPATASPSTSNGLDNPLARFSLPSLPVPSTGEAGLYHAPPAFTYGPSSSSHQGYSNLAYGAYPQFPHNGPGGGLPPPPLASHTSNAAVPNPGMAGKNLEERIREVRRNWVGQGGEVVAQAQVEAEGGRGGVVPAAGTPASALASTRGAAGQEEGEGEQKKQDSSKQDSGTELAKAAGRAEKEEEGAEKDEESSEDSSITPREAALRAAERRAAKGKGKEIIPPIATSSTPSASPSTLMTASLERPTAAAQNGGSSETIVPPPASSSSTQSRRFSSLRPSSATLPPSKSSTSAGASSLPRLIPLFDPSARSISTLSHFYPSLFSSSPLSSSAPLAPLVPSQPTSDQLSELDRLASQAIRDKLKLLERFQGRIEELVGEMKGALEGQVAAEPEKGQVGGAGEVDGEGEGEGTSEKSEAGGVA